MSEKVIEMNVCKGNSLYDTLHPITEAAVVQYTKNGEDSNVQTVLSETSDNMTNISATAVEVETRQHGLFIIARNTEVPSSAFVSNATYPDYPFRATINVTGCTVDYVPDIYFDLDTIALNIFAPIAQTGDGVVYIYASSRPSETITIPTIKLATEADRINPTKVLGTIDISRKPFKLEYRDGENIDYLGLEVKAHYSNGSVRTLEYGTYDVNPAYDTAVHEGDSLATITYTENGVQKTVSFNFTVGPAVDIVGWSEGTDEQIVAMVEALDEGKLTIAQTGWGVGDRRKISLGSFQTYSKSVVSTSTQGNQTAYLILMGVGGKTLANGDECNFVVGFADNVCKSFWGTTSNNYASSLIKTVEQNIYNAIPSEIKPIFKQWNVVTGTSTTPTVQYLASPAEKEVMGTGQYSSSTESGSLAAIPYYSTSAHRMHNNYNTAWWNRSPSATLSNHACNIISDSENGTAAVNMEILGVSPIGCI